mgnify:CR=1 FL=1
MVVGLDLWADDFFLMASAQVLVAMRVQCDNASSDDSAGEDCGERMGRACGERI